MSSMNTSEKGRAFLERHEGVVLRAYRDTVGVLTIGAGLTKASGVVDPKPGMTITAEDASRLLTLALRRNYEPAVRYALQRRGRDDCAQHEFDGALSFHFNTGSIGRASWVDAWHMDNRQGVRAGLLKWVKGGGKVLPGLKRRREEEARLILDGVYDPSEALPKRRLGVAQITLRLSAGELAATRDGLKALGYDPGPDARYIALDAVWRFQTDHDLTVDGIVGRATLTTLQRRLDARRKGGRTVAGGAGGAAATQAPGSILENIADSTVLMIVGAIAALVALRLAWSYRDVVAVKVQHLSPKLANWLRSR